MSANGGQSKALKRSTMCYKTNEGLKNPFKYAGDVYLKKCEFQFKQRKSIIYLNTADRRAAQKGLNLHFILDILFSTNKLTPEKT